MADQFDAMPHIDTWGATEEQACDLHELDAAIYENLLWYGQAAVAIAESRSLDDLSEPQQLAAAHISRVLDTVGNRITFDTETADRLEQDPRRQALVKQLKAEKDPRHRETLRRRISAHDLGDYASRVVTDFLAIDNAA